jgi:hypothetical protein
MLLWYQTFFTSICIFLCTSLPESWGISELKCGNFSITKQKIIICINLCIYLYKSECMYVCMFRHNYLSVNDIVSLSSFTWLCKYKEEYKQGEMWHSNQNAEISKELCMFLPGYCQATGTWLISAETNNEELLIARQWFRNHGHINGNNWSRRLWMES